MGCDCCGPPAPIPEPVAAPDAALVKETSSCQDSCCDGDDAEPLEIMAPGQGEPTQEKPGCCSSSKCADDKAQDVTDAPACCRGKVSPCCDASCIDRLAMRECEVSASAGPDAKAESE
jgi:Cd2+-exporting ATPase